MNRNLIHKSVSHLIYNNQKYAKIEYYQLDYI